MTTQIDYRDQKPIKCLYRTHIIYGQIRLQILHVVSHTKCGVWVNHDFRKRFVNLNSKKQYASVSKEKSVESFFFRKRRHLSILKYQVAEIERAMKFAESGISCIGKRVEQENFLL